MLEDGANNVSKWSLQPDCEVHSKELNDSRGSVIYFNAPGEEIYLLLFLSGSDISRRMMTQQYQYPDIYWQVLEWEIALGWGCR